MNDTVACPTAVAGRNTNVARVTMIWCAAASATPVVAAATASRPSTPNLISMVDPKGSPTRAMRHTVVQTGQPRPIRRPARAVRRRSSRCAVVRAAMALTNMATPAPVMPRAGSGPGPRTSVGMSTTEEPVLTRPTHRASLERPRAISNVVAEVWNETTTTVRAIRWGKEPKAAMVASGTPMSVDRAGTAATARPPRAPAHRASHIASRKVDSRAFGSSPLWATNGMEPRSAPWTTMTAGLNTATVIA